MSLNSDFLTDDEKKTFAKHHEGTLDGNLVTDNIPANEFFANPTAGEMPILLDDLKLIDSLESQLADLGELKELLMLKGGVNRQIAASFESYLPELLQKRPINSFSSHLSKTNYVLSIEEIDRKRIALYGGLIAAILGLCYKLYKWLFGGSSSDGDGGGGVANPTDVVARSEQASASAEIVQAVENVAAPVVSRNPKAAKETREEMEAIKNLLDASTESRIIGLIGHNDKIKNLYRKIVADAPGQFDQIKARLSELQKAIDWVGSFIDARSGIDLAQFSSQEKFKGSLKAIAALTSTDGGKATRTTGFGILTPSIEARNPNIQHPAEYPVYTFTTGVLMDGNYIDIDSLTFFLKDQSGFMSLLDQYNPKDLSVETVAGDIVRLTESGIIAEFKNIDRTLSRSMGGVNDTIETTTEALGKVLEKLPKNQQESIRSSVPEGVATDGNEPSNQIAEDRERFKDYERFFKFLEGELVFKGREISNWGMSIGIIAKHVSIINVRLIGKICSTKGRLYSKMRQNLFGDEEKRDGGDMMELNDGLLLGVLETILAQVTAGQQTLLSQPREVTSLIAKFRAVWDKVSQATQHGPHDRTKYDEYQSLLAELSAQFKENVDEKVSAKIDKWIKHNEQVFNAAAPAE